MLGLKRVTFVALFLFIISNVFVYADEILLESQRNEIIDFTLFNFDNLIADHFEGNGEYSFQLASLLSEATDTPSPVFIGILNDHQLNTELNAVRYMLKINHDVKQKTGFYFVHQ